MWDKVLGKKIWDFSFQILSDYSFDKIWPNQNDSFKNGCNDVQTNNLLNHTFFVKNIEQSPRISIGANKIFRKRLKTVNHVRKDGWKKNFNRSNMEIESQQNINLP